MYLRKLKGHTHAEARRCRKIKVANFVVLRTAKIRGNALEIIGNVGEEGSSRVETLEASKKKTTMPRSLCFERLRYFGESNERGHCAQMRQKEKGCRAFEKKETKRKVCREINIGTGQLYTGIVANRLFQI